MDLAGISLTETDGQVFLRHQPVAGRVPVDAAMLHALLDQAGYAGCLVNEEAITRAAAECNTQQIPFVVQVADRRDAAIQVEVAPDEMAAQVSLVAPQGGKPASVDEVLQALADAGVVFGIDTAALAQACAAGQVAHVAVASGAAPENGRDTAFEPLLPKTTDRAPKLDANGLIDYREHGGITVVKPGEALMRRVPPTPGVAGHTVRGRELPPRAGVDEPFAPALAGAQVASDDPNLLKAAVTGQPVLVDRGVTVEPLLRVKEVNLATGNIYFDGTVQVDGEVMHGMKVQASGDIVVGGTVDGGLLEAGGIIAQAQAQVQARSSGRRFRDRHDAAAGSLAGVQQGRGDPRQGGR